MRGGEGGANRGLVFKACHMKAAMYVRQNYIIVM